MWESIFGTISFPGSDTLGLPYTYVVTIPAGELSGTGETIRLRLQGPPSGQLSIQSMWIGHPSPTGPAYAFDGAQVQVFVSGASSFDLGTTEVVSDELIFEPDQTKPLLVAYSAIAGDQYANTQVVPGNYQLSYKASVHEAGLAEKAGYASLSSWFATVAGIDVFNDTTPPPTPDPDPEPTDPGTSNPDQVLAGERISAGGEQSGEAGEYTTFQLKNPTASGVTCLAHQIIITPDSDSIVSVRAYNPDIGSPLITCNALFGAGLGAECVASKSTQSQLLGVEHAVINMRGGQPYTMRADVPLIGLLQGMALTVVVHQPGVGATVNFEWREIAA